MTIHYFHLLCTIVFILYSFRMSLAKAVLNFIYIAPFYSVSLVEFSGSFIKPSELYAAALAILFFLKGGRLKKKPVIFACLFFCPFVLSLLVNLYDFNPIDAWELNAENRDVFYEKLTHKTEITVTNFTQLLYVVVGLVSFVVVASVDMRQQRDNVERAIRRAILMVSAIGFFQVLSYYGGFYEAYLTVFYNSEAVAIGRQVWFEISGVKRINSVFGEPSIFGFYLGVSLLVLLALREWRVGGMVRKFGVWVSLIAGLISTAGTFYYCAMVLCLFYVLHNLKRFFIIPLCIIGGLSVVVVAAYVVQIAPQFVDQKLASLAERLQFGFYLPITNFLTNPFFGAAFGTDRPTTLVFNLLVSLGGIGVFMVALAASAIWNKGVGAVLVFWIIAGMLVPDIIYLYVWLYLGIMFSIFSGKSRVDPGVVKNTSGTLR
ncbi:hypothetical protein F3I62_13610 [Pseudomonas sp. R-28-1W-6]|uniref:hypothetical protein n=1 Tax=Pseudomonas sp. R-28-1W-6 TaxID=2650101 RepID=UPI0013667E88|nr:hypothetical protein [Pseudomonas sp. R-28-1W-6]MWV13138.1 hypothetical protein [Pseudomonas sp. R-28-1W-6]